VPRLVPLAKKVSKRLYRRVPLTLSQLTQEVKDSLQSSWWYTADEILLKNAIIKEFSHYVRPAEHLFNTMCKEMLNLVSDSYSEFVDNLQRTLGSSWDDQLQSTVQLFFKIAVNVKAKFSKSDCHSELSTSPTSCDSS